VKLLLLTSRKLKFGSIVCDLGIEPTNLLFWRRTQASEVQWVSDTRRLSDNLLLNRSILTRFFPLQMFLRIGLSSAFVETSSCCSNPLAPSFGGSVPLNELLNP
jgi:hypothetical protein